MIHWAWKGAHLASGQEIEPVYQYGAQHELAASIDIIEGDGGVGSIKQINYAGDKIEKVCYDIKFEGSADGGSISKMTTTIYTHGDFEIKEEELKAGDGGVGSIKQINYDGGFAKHKIDEVDEKTFTYKYTLIEGNGISDKIEKVCYDIKFEGSADGGSISKMTTTIYTYGDFEIKEEELKAGKEKVLGLYKVVEAYLIKNPDAYV
ncbi:hypothetical protein E3N88_14603 [Mikania micrantha]|uniref:Bet v I/Major latex protein domain-containing protein n=1 Tax=Mikania micrantha TaxID=192012 RepID=A0A5N6P3V6_9ASTR|nr:hypothetical protein E3N88_14603 [Mikania micrantha]